MCVCVCVCVCPWEGGGGIEGGGGTESSMCAFRPLHTRPARKKDKKKEASK